MSPFVFQWPILLLLLLPVVGLALLMKRARIKRALLIEKMGGGKRVQERVRDWTRITACVLLVLALARPGYAPERRSVSQSGRDVVFAIDVSQSMLAPDAQPSRLEASKQGIRDALDRLSTERVGLVIYAGSATILCPLTYDYGFVRYMLEQANPRAVDFGGTTLLAAVEKSVDNLYTDERRGMQDLVVMTDGEDHGPDMQRVTGLLKENDVDLLLVGLGDASVGSRIPIEDESGAKTFLKHDGQVVYTKLQDASLRELAGNVPEARYIAAGIIPFHLGDIYMDYVSGKPVSGAVGAETYVVYKEGGLFLVAIGLILLLAGDYMGRRYLSLLVLTSVIAMHPQQGIAQTLEEAFTTARDFQLHGSFGEAMEAYGELELNYDHLLGPEKSAAIRFNQALCNLSHAEAIVQESPQTALALARQAQVGLLEAKRLSPRFDRAGMRLDTTAVLIADYTKLARLRQEQEQAIEEEIKELIDRLERLRDNQSGLHDQVRESDPNADPARRRKANLQPIQPPVDAEADSRKFTNRQKILLEEGKSIQESMKVLDAMLSPPLPEGESPIESLMAEPMRLMEKAVDAQSKAVSFLGLWGTWQAARPRQLDAVARIQEILDLLAGDNTGESDDEDWGDYEEDWDMEEYDDSEMGNPSSMMMQGDLAAGSEMQPLPIPNYSAEELLMEEQGNLQFRQEQRAKAQAGKVEKDW
ncbi:MAG: VWA domain-containing protein [Puniceicoccaceae bacterium]